MQKDFIYYLEMARQAIPVKAEDLKNSKKVFEEALDEKIKEIDNDKHKNFIIRINELDLPGDFSTKSNDITYIVKSLKPDYAKAGWAIGYDGEFEQIHLTKIGKK